MPTVVPPPLRSDLKIRKQVQSGEVCYVVKDPEKQSYYRFDDANYEMLATFDGEHPLERLVEIFNEESEEYEYDVAAAHDLYLSAKGISILKRSPHEENIALLERLKEERKQKLLQRKGSLLRMRFPIVDPSNIFPSLLERIGFLWHPAVVRLCLGLMVCAVVLVCFCHKRFAHDAALVYGDMGAEDFLGIWLIVLGIIALHECGHGLTCQYFGGEVNEMGFLLLAFQPCLYCNVSDAWMFDNTRHKVYVTLAGVYVEFMVAVAAVVVWFFVGASEPVGRIAFIAMTITTSSSVLFNLNPLMRYDGYYLLSDTLEVPNLRNNAMAWTSWTLKRVLLGLDLEPPVDASDREIRIYQVYGSLIFLYLTAMLTALSIIGYNFVADRFGIIGMLFYVYFVFKIVRKLMGTWPATLKEWAKERYLSGKRRWITEAVLAAFVLMLLFLCPPVRVSGPCTLRAEQVVVHAPEDGFVQRVGYDAARNLTAASKNALLVMYSPTLEMEARLLKARVDSLTAARRAVQADGLRAEARRLGVEVEAATEQLDSVMRRLRSLKVLVPAGEWLVQGPPPQMLAGRHFTKGSVILGLVPKNQHLAEVELNQRDFSLVAPGQKAKLRLAGDRVPLLRGAVEMVVPVGKAEGLEDKFIVRVRLDDTTRFLPQGTKGDATIFGAREPLWQQLGRKLRRAVRGDLWI